MDAFFVISAPVIASPTSESAPSSSSEFDETIVDRDSFGYIGWHSGCIIS
nr:pheromone precursor [Ganoderma boninense]